LTVRLKQTHKAWQDIWLGAEFGTQVETGTESPGHDKKGDQKVGPGEDIELLGVEEATDVAKSAAEKSGWKNIPWKELLETMLSFD
jgi:hypothetical protein